MPNCFNANAAGKEGIILMPTFGIRVHSVKFIPAVHPALDESLTNLLLFILRGEC